MAMASWGSIQMWLKSKVEISSWGSRGVSLVQEWERSNVRGEKIQSVPVALEGGSI